MSETRGIRGATTVDDARPEHVTEAVVELLDELQRANALELTDVASVIFTLTGDLADAAPAAVARSHGWQDVPLLQVLEHGGATGVRRCIRVLVLWNTTTEQNRIRHVYLRGATALRAGAGSLGEEA